MLYTALGQNHSLTSHHLHSLTQQKPYPTTPIPTSQPLTQQSLLGDDRITTNGLMPISESLDSSRQHSPHGSSINTYTNPSYSIFPTTPSPLPHNQPPSNHIPQSNIGAMVTSPLVTILQPYHGDCLHDIVHPQQAAPNSPHNSTMSLYLPSFHLPLLILFMVPTTLS